uniref:Uncharacterized protein n=1 Tax=Anguilla anguilla TaxID=7936 RepID=A0A0E9WJU9_ANGAN
MHLSCVYAPFINETAGILLFHMLKSFFEFFLNKCLFVFLNFGLLLLQTSLLNQSGFYDVTLLTESFTNESLQ